MNRPTEAVTGPPLAALVFAFVTDHGGSLTLGIILGVIAGFGPLVVSATVDAIRKRQTNEAP